MDSSIHIACFLFYPDSNRCFLPLLPPGLRELAEQELWENTPKSVFVDVSGSGLVKSQNPWCHPWQHPSLWRVSQKHLQIIRSYYPIIVQLHLPPRPPCPHLPVWPPTGAHPLQLPTVIPSWFPVSPHLTLKLHCCQTLEISNVGEFRKANSPEPEKSSVWQGWGDNLYYLSLFSQVTFHLNFRL